MTINNNNDEIPPLLLAKCIHAIRMVKNNLEMWEHLPKQRRDELIDNASKGTLTMESAFGAFGDILQEDIDQISHNICSVLNKESPNPTIYAAVHEQLSIAIRKASYYLLSTNIRCSQQEIISLDIMLPEGSLEEETDDVHAQILGASPAERDKIFQEVSAADLDGETLLEYYEWLITRAETLENKQKLFEVRFVLEHLPVD